VFRNAAIGGADLHATLVTRERASQVTGSHGLVVIPQDVLTADVDLVLVPGGGWNDRAEEGAWGEAERGALPAALRDLSSRGVAVGSICTGAMLLAVAGLTKGRPAVTHHSALDGLRASGAEVIDARVVDDGDLLTAGGVTSGIDLALWIVEREAGPELAEAVAREMEHERRGPVWRPSR
jgi:transcriptional regulator GlxA family with amidase domain